MRYSTRDGDDIDVYVTVGEISNEPDRQIEFEEVTVSVRRNEIEGQLRSNTDDETIAELETQDRPLRIEVESRDGTETPTIEARVKDNTGKLEITGIE